MEPRPCRVRRMTVTSEVGAVDVAQKHIAKTKMITSVGIAPAWTRSLTQDDANQCALYCGTLSDVSSWTFADLLVWAEDKAPDLEYRRSYWNQLCQISKRTYAPHSLLNLAAVARAFPWERRRHTDVLSFRHHRLVVSMSTSRQEYWLDMAQDMNWSSRRMEMEIRDEREEPLAVLPPPSVSAWFEMMDIQMTRVGTNVMTLDSDTGVLTITAVATEHGTAQLSITVKDTTHGKDTGAD